MTLISKRKTIIRAETSCAFRGRPLIVTLGAYSFQIREKGRRKAFELSWDSAFTLAASKEAERLRAERKANKRKKGYSK